MSATSVLTRGCLLNRFLIRLRHYRSCTANKFNQFNPSFFNYNTTLKQLHTSPIVHHGEYELKEPESEEDVVMISIVRKNGQEVAVRGKIGDNLLYLAKRFDIEMEGACEASLACTTCHVYIDDDFLDTLPPATETEEDLLDQAPFLRENSRLGCQIILSKDLDGLKLTLPQATKNFYVDGHKPSHH